MRLDCSGYGRHKSNAGRQRYRWVHGGGVWFDLPVYVIFAFFALPSWLRRPISFRKAFIQLEIVELSDLVLVAGIDILDDLEAFHFA